MILETDTPKDVWDSLKSTCRAASSANQNFLVTDFRSRNFNGRTGILQHMHEIRYLRFQLISTGHNITDKDLVTTTLASIRHMDYEMVINILMIARKETLFLEDLQAEWIFYENRLARRDHRSGRKSSEEAAYQARETRRCFNCNRHDHLSPDCRAKRNPLRQRHEPAA